MQSTSVPRAAFSSVSVSVSASNTDVDRLGDAIAEAAAQIDAAMHRLLEMIRKFDACEGYARHGARSAAHWLSWRIGLAPGTARERVRVARALGELPVMDDALRRGEISYSKVRAMTRVATEHNEARLVAMAREATGAELETLCRGLQGVLQSVAPGNERACAERWVRHRTTDSGMVRLEAQLHPDEAAVVMKALAQAREQAGPARDTEVDVEVPADSNADLAAAVPAGTDRNVSAGTWPDFRTRQADALVRIADSFLGRARRAGQRSGAERAQLFVHLAPGRLDPEGVLEATLQDGTPLAPATFLRLACDCGLVPVRTDDAGKVLDVGRRIRAIPVPLQRALQARDRTCRFPGCDATAFVDAHHVKHWARGGETKLSNLLKLCRTHHTAVHEGGFRIEKKDDAFSFYTPDGWLLPRVPDAPGVPAEAMEVLRERHAADGLHIHPDVQLGSFRLEPIDFDWAATALLADGATVMQRARSQQ